MRVDSGVEAGADVAGHYDPLVAKLVVHGVNREHARQRMLRALDEYEIGGLQTLLGFHRALLRHACFIEAGTCRGSSSRKSLRRKRHSCLMKATSITSAQDGRLRPRAVAVELDGRRFDVRVLEPSRRTRSSRDGVASEPRRAVDRVLPATR